MPADQPSAFDSPDASPHVAGWLQPLAGSPCGDDLEYDLEFLELGQAAAGKPETQFSAAEPPAWPQVQTLCESLLARTRDLRVAVPWARARVALDGLVGLPDGLCLLHGLLDTFWDTLHPLPDPDDGDAFARLSALGTLADAEGLFGDVRQGLLLDDRRLDGLRTRDVEIALDRLAPRADETVRSLSHIQGLVGDAPQAADRLRAALAASRETLRALQGLMNERFGIERAIDLQPLRGLLDAVAQALPDAGTGASDGAAGNDLPADGDEVPAPRMSRRGGAGGDVESREDALRAIQRVIAFLERTEPTNPAQFLLRRAERLIDKNFLQLVRDLAPEAMTEVARILGVDPDSISVEN